MDSYVLVTKMLNSLLQEEKMNNIPFLQVPMMHNYVVNSQYIYEVVMLTKFERGSGKSSRVGKHCFEKCFTSVSQPFSTCSPL